MTTIPILFTFDQSLEMPAGVCMSSLLEHADKDTFYDIFVLHGPDCDFSQSLLNRLPEIYGNCRLTFRKVVGEFVSDYEIRGIPKTVCPPNGSNWREGILERRRSKTPMTHTSIKDAL